MTSYEWPRQSPPCSPELGRGIAYEACIDELMFPTCRIKGHRLDKPGRSRVDAELRAAELLRRWFL